MFVTEVYLENFTVFRNVFRMEFPDAPGLHIFTGVNASGKTHLLQAMYAAVSLARKREPGLGEWPPYAFAERLVSVFRPFPADLGRLAFRKQGSIDARIAVRRGKNLWLELEFSNHTHGYVGEPDGEKSGNRRGKLQTHGLEEWSEHPVGSVFLPAQEVLSYAHGSVHTAYRMGVVALPEHHVELMEMAISSGFSPGKYPQVLKNMLENLQEEFGREVEVDRSQQKIFVVEKYRKKLEVPLVADGIRKLALLWILLKSRRLSDASILFWDEPEAHLHPRWIRLIARFLFSLAKQFSLQVFVATHSPVFLQEVDYLWKRLLENGRGKEKGKFGVKFYVLDRKARKGIEVYSADRLAELQPDPLYDVLWELYEETL